MRRHVSVRENGRQLMVAISNEALEWLDRAEQAREVAWQLTDPDARKAVLSLQPKKPPPPEPVFAVGSMEYEEQQKRLAMRESGE
jgi:hypothetical protein